MSSTFSIFERSMLSYETVCTDARLAVTEDKTEEEVEDREEDEDEEGREDAGEDTLDDV